MALAHRADSPYYPPRARWTAPLLDARDQLLRAMALDRIDRKLGADVRLLPLIAGFFVPGLAFVFRVPGLIARLALAWAALLIVAFFALLGSGWDNFIYAMLLSVHVSGFSLYCNPLLGPELRNRLIFTVLALVLIQLVVYYPAQQLIDAYLVSPLEWRGKVVIVERQFAPNSIRPGDWLAYRVDGGFESEYGGEWTPTGADLAPVLALPGDRVEFDTDTYRVSGVPHPRLPNMPREGAFLVPRKEWFVWPNLDIHRYNYSDAAVAKLLQQRGMVTEDQIIGVPCQSWFGRRQLLP